MRPGESQSLLAAAAAGSLKRVEEDRDRAPERLKPLLAFIARRLFDPRLDVTYLMRQTGVRDNSISVAFHAAAGHPPGHYIEDRRLETACRLLHDTALKVWQIAELVGYSSLNVFSRAFNRWARTSASEYRRQGQARREAGEPEIRDPAERTLHRALGREADPEEARALVTRLLALYPELEVTGTKVEIVRR